MTAPAVLIVDDERPIRRSLVRLLVDEAVEPIEADGGETAREILRRRTVAVLLVDHHLAGMNGVEFLRVARRMQPNGTRILFSGHVDVGILQEAVNAGEVAGFISKPWEDDEVILAVRQGVERWRLLEERDRLTRLNQNRTEELRRVNRELRRRCERRAEDLAVHGRALDLGRELLDHLPLIVVGVDPDGIVTTVNLLATEVLPDLLPGATAGEGLPVPVADWLRDTGRSHNRPLTVSLAGATWQFQTIALERRGRVVVGFQIPPREAEGIA